MILIFLGIDSACKCNQQEYAIVRLWDSAEKEGVKRCKLQRCCVSMIWAVLISTWLMCCMPLGISLPMMQSPNVSSSRKVIKCKATSTERNIWVWCYIMLRIGDAACPHTVTQATFKTWSWQQKALSGDRSMVSSCSMLRRHSRWTRICLNPRFTTFFQTAGGLQSTTPEIWRS